MYLVLLKRTYYDYSDNSPKFRSLNCNHAITSLLPKTLMICTILWCKVVICISRMAEWCKFCNSSILVTKLQMALALISASHPTQSTLVTQVPSCDGNASGIRIGIIKPSHSWYIGDTGYQWLIQHTGTNFCNGFSSWPQLLSKSLLKARMTIGWKAQLHL